MRWHLSALLWALPVFGADFVRIDVLSLFKPSEAVVKTKRLIADDLELHLEGPSAATLEAAGDKVLTRIGERSALAHPVQTLANRG